MATATGFYYQIDDSLWLITNWHNVTGFDPDTQKRIPDIPASPTGIGIPIILKTERGIEWKWHKLQLYTKEKPNWLVHPKYKTRVDVIAIHALKNVSENNIISINTVKWDDIKPIVADNVYVLGFPYGLRAGGNFPIWKRATIASEPDIDYAELPQFIIDSTTRKGMSGAPVIMRRQGIHNLNNGEIIHDTLIGEVQNFIGIYSGRFYADEKEETQLGRVWKADIIQEIIDRRIQDEGYYPNFSDINHIT